MICPQVGQRLKQPMQRFWRRKSSSPGTSLGDGGSRKSVTPWTAVDSLPSAGGPRSSVGGPRSSVGGSRSSVGGGGSRTDAKKSGVSETSGLAAVPEAAEEELVSRSASDVDVEEHGGTTPDQNTDTESPAVDETTPDRPDIMESVGDDEDDEDDDEVDDDDEDEKDEDEE